MSANDHAAARVQLKFNGIWAILVVVAILALSVYRYMAARDSLSQEGARELKTWVTAEYQRYQIGRHDIGESEKATLIAAAAEVEFESLSARGAPDKMVVKATIKPNPAEPPGTSRVRYFRMSYSPLTGWRHRGDTTAFAYLLRVF